MATIPDMYRDDSDDIPRFHSAKQRLDNKDACQHCKVKGDFEVCKKTTCNLHESWYAKEMDKKIQELCQIIVDLKKQIMNRL